MLSTIFYNATAIDVVTGTGAGVLNDIQSYNQISYNVTEVNSDYELRVNFSIGNTAVAGYVVECYLKYPDMSIAKPKINLTDLGTGYYNYPNFYNFTTNDSKGVYTINCENLNNSYTYSTVVNLNATGTLSSFVVKNWLLVERCIHNQSNYCTQAINATHTGYNIRGEVVESGHASGYSLGEELSFDTNPLTCNNDVTYRKPFRIM